MLRSDLMPWIDRWLASGTRRWHLRFPPVLESIFERDTGAERGRLLAILVAGGGFAYLAWDITGGLSGIPWAYRVSHALALGPFVLLGFIILRGRPPALLREAVISLLLAISGAALAALYASGAWQSAAMNNTAMILTIMLGTLVLQIRVPFAIAATLALLAVHAAGLMTGPPLPTTIKAQFLEVTAVAAAIALIANWRQEREMRRSYLLGLKEKLSREALSADNRALDDLARRDQLTGLPNRRAFDNWLEGPMPWPAELRGVSLIAIDIDHFKPYNDHYGHPAGDACLRRVAACLREQLRDRTDLVARIGGEEFAVLLPGAGAAEAERLAELLRAAVEAMEVPHEAPGARGRVTISAGVAAAPWLGTVPAQALILRADAALYAAKQAGRNQVRVAAAAEFLAKKG